MELSIVLGICGVILAGAWGLVSTLMEDVKRDQAIQQVIVTVKGVRDYYAAQAGIPVGMTFPVMTDLLIRENVIPNEMIRARSNCAAPCLRADHPWGANRPNGTLMANGSFAVNDNNAGAGNNSYFQIEFRGLTLSTCLVLSLRLSGATIPSGLSQIQINASGNLTRPVSLATARTWCTAAGAGNTLGLVYLLREPGV